MGEAPSREMPAALGRFAGLGGGAILGLAVPLAGAALVYAMWWFVILYSDPGTRSTSQWIVFATWGAIGLLAGWVWSFLPERMNVRLAAASWGLLALAGAALFWSEIVTEGQRCDNGPRSAPVELGVPSLLIGIVVAAMPALTALFTSGRFRADRPVSALVAAVIINVTGFVTAALVASFVLITTAGCNRP